MTDTLEDTLAHHGVLGMHWGERNAETQSREGTASTGTSTGKKVAIGLGIGVGAAAIAAGAFYVNKKLKTNIKISDIVTDPRIEKAIFDRDLAIKQINSAADNLGLDRNGPEYIAYMDNIHKGFQMTLNQLKAVG